jgi:hypothetical protein
LGGGRAQVVCEGMRGIVIIIGCTTIELEVVRPGMTT